MVLETLVSLPFNQLTRLVARELFHSITNGYIYILFLPILNVTGREETI
jgi:hypothetical protein